MSQEYRELLGTFKDRQEEYFGNVKNAIEEIVRLSIMYEEAKYRCNKLNSSIKEQKNILDKALAEIGYRWGFE